jgi:hypothetical protein
MHRGASRFLELLSLLKLTDFVPSFWGAVQCILQEFFRHSLSNRFLSYPFPTRLWYGEKDALKLSRSVLLKANSQAD